MEPLRHEWTRMSPSVIAPSAELDAATRPNPPVQEPDVLPRRLLLRITWVAVCLTIALAVAAKLLLDWRLGLLEPGRGIGATHTVAVPALHAGQPIAGSRVHRDLFPRSTDLTGLSADPPELHRYGWIDRRRGIVHIPIETAIDLELTEGGR
jgi:hypothetical protein